MASIIQTQWACRLNLALMLGLGLGEDTGTGRLSGTV